MLIIHINLALNFYDNNFESKLFNSFDFDSFFFNSPLPSITTWITAGPPSAESGLFSPPTRFSINSLKNPYFLSS